MTDKNEWKLVPVSLYDLILTGDLEALLWQLKGVREAEEVRMALYNARQAILAAEEYSDCTPPASAQDEPITVSLDPDPRGVSVGVWQGPRCIYTGAHAVPVSAQDDAKDDEAQAILRWIMRAAESAKEDCGMDPETPAAIRNGKLASIASAAAQALGLHGGPSYSAFSDAQDTDRLEWIAQSAWAIRDLENGRKNALVWQQPRTAPEGALYRLRGAIDAARAASQQQEG